MFSYFYRYSPNALPPNAQYYFNVLVYCIPVSQEQVKELFPNGETDIWFLDKLTDSRPKAFHLYIEEAFDDPIDYECFYDDNEEWEYEEDVDWAIHYFPHSVVEILPSGEVSFYSMLDFDCPDFWRID